MESEKILLQVKGECSCATAFHDCSTLSYGVLSHRLLMNGYFISVSILWVTFALRIPRDSASSICLWQLFDILFVQGIFWWLSSWLFLTASCASQSSLRFQFQLNIHPGPDQLHRNVLYSFLMLPEMVGFLLRPSHPNPDAYLCHCYFPGVGLSCSVTTQMNWEHIPDRYSQLLYATGITMHQIDNRSLVFLLCQASCELTISPLSL